MCISHKFQIWGGKSAFETVNLENIDCLRLVWVNPDVLKYKPYFVPNFLLMEGKSNAKVGKQVSKP